MDIVDYARYAGALLFTLGLLGLGFLVLRRFGPHLGATMTDARARRVNIVESRLIDARRRLVVIRFGDREHLVLLGASGEQLIASETAPSQDESVSISGETAPAQPGRSDES